MAGNLLRVGSGTLHHARNSLGTDAVEGGPDRGVGSVEAARGLERMVRDSVGGRLYSGTSEMQAAIIARTLGL